MDYKQRRTMWYSPKRGRRFPYERQPGKASALDRPDLVGERFGMVEIVSPKLKRVSGYRRAFCRCLGCGAEKWVSLDNLLSGKTGGCQRCNQPRVTPLWLQKRLSAARDRCVNPKNPAYADYGGRGIEFRFLSATAAGLWVAANLGLDRTRELDRVDNDGHYEPGNLRWATRSQNVSNSRGKRETSARFHQFRMRHPDVRYADSTLRGFIRRGLSFREILERYRTPSCKPKGRYGTFSIADPVIALQCPG